MLSNALAWAQPALGCQQMCSLATQLLHLLGSYRSGAGVWKGTFGILRAITIVLRECRDCTCSEPSHPLAALLLQNWPLITQAMSATISHTDQHHGYSESLSSFSNLLSAAAGLRSASDIVPPLATSLAIGFAHAPHGSWLQCIVDLSNCESVRAQHAVAFSQLLAELQHAFMQSLQTSKAGPAASKPCADVVCCVPPVFSACCMPRVVLYVVYPDAGALVPAWLSMVSSLLLSWRELVEAVLLGDLMRQSILLLAHFLSQEHPVKAPVEALGFVRTLAAVRSDSVARVLNEPCAEHVGRASSSGPLLTGSQIVRCLLHGMAGSMPSADLREIVVATRQLWDAFGDEVFQRWMLEAVGCEGTPTASCSHATKAAFIKDIFSEKSRKMPQHFKQLLKRFCGGKRKGAGEVPGEAS